MVATAHSTRSGARPGALLLASGLIVVLGASLAVLQYFNIVEGWEICWEEPVGDVTDAGDMFGLNISALLRLGAYPVILLVVAAPFLAMARWEPRIRPRAWFGVMAAMVLAIAVFVFWADYTLFNYLHIGTVSHDRCPDGRPPWWPLP